MKIIILLFSVLSTIPLYASGIPGLATAYGGLMTRVKHRINQNSLVAVGRPNHCNQQVLNVSADGKIEIAVAFGYMDFTAGQDFKDSGAAMYGSGDVLDVDAKAALGAMLMSSCSGRSKACGFRKRGSHYTKRIKDRFTNKSINVTIQLISSAVSSDDVSNRGRYTSKQAKNSRNAKNAFLSALQVKDAVIYMGHARSGGGPDFNPPILTGNGHVDYNYYRSNRQGIQSMLGALNQAREPASIIGVLACKSTGLFAGSIRRYAPRSLLVTADALFDYNDMLPSGYAMIEAIVSQQCGSEFARVTKAQPGSGNFLSIYE